MENASKALLIAGGILLAILILSALVFMFSSVRNFSESQEEKTLAEQTARFNAEYDVYNKSVMYGTDVISVINKGIDHNLRVGDYESNIDIILNLSAVNFNETPGESSIGNRQYNISVDYRELQNFFNSNSSNLNNFKASIFKCTGIIYDKTGRISSMTFEYRKDKNDDNK